MPVSEFAAAWIEARPEEGTGGQPGLLDVFGDGLGGLEVQTDGPALVALFVEPDRRLDARCFIYMDAGDDGKPGARPLAHDVDRRPAPAGKGRVGKSEFRSVQSRFHFIVLLLAAGSLR